MKTLYLVALFAGAFIIGSFSGAIWLSKRLPRGDVREQGSGNAGATNMARVYGMGYGLAVLGIDMIKAALAMLAGKALMGDAGLCACGLGCIFGHCYPLFHDFKGGKGVSVGAMVALMIDWRVFAAAVVTFLIVALAGKKVSLGSMCAGLAIVICTVLIHAPVEKLVLAVVCVVLVIFRHRENILRLIKGTEPDFRAGKSKD